MSHTIPKPLIVKIITEQDEKTIYEFINQYFYDGEPLTESLKWENKESLTNIDGNSNFTSCINENLSVMAVTPSNEIIGVVLNRKVIVNNEEKKTPGETNLGLVKIRKLLAELQEQMENFTKTQNCSHKEMRVTFLTVHPKWRNRGIGYALVEYTRKIAEENGFNQISGICTNAYSARILEKVGFSYVHSIQYEDYKENGKVIFKINPPHTHAKALMLRI